MKCSVMNPSRALACFLCTCSLLAAQTEWVVDAAGGAGSQFTDIQSAVDAAADGDRILVRAGTYVSFAIDGKALTVLGDPGTFLFGFWPTVTVRHTFAGQDVVVAGLAGVQGLSLSGVKIEDCAGRVVFEQVVASDWQIVDAGDVRINACRLNVRTAVVRSRVTIVSSRVSSGLVVNGEPALAVIDSEVMVARCDVTGQGPYLRAPATAAIEVQAAGVVTLTDDGSHVIAAGSSPNHGLPAVRGDGTVIRNPRVRLVGSGGAPGVSVGDDRIEHVPALEALGAPVGSTVEVDLAGLPGESWALVFALPGPPLRVAGIRGELGFSQALVSLQGVFGAQSEHLSLVVGPGLPPGFGLCWQAVATDGQGGFALSNHATYTRLR